MSESQSAKPDGTSDDDLAALLARRDKKGRAKSTTVLLAVLLVLLGVLIGVPLGRASAPAPAPISTEADSSAAGNGLSD